MDYKFLTWNVNGANAPQKRKKIFYYLQKLKQDVICMQETHIKKEDFKYLVNKKLGKEFVSASGKKKNGVVLYIKPRLNPKLVMSDEQ